MAMLFNFRVLELVSLATVLSETKMPPRRTPNAERRTPNAERRTLNAER
jgi:hypothetical protein